MKALRSSLVNRLLADPVARDELRRFAESTMRADRPDPQATVRLETDGKTVVYRPTIVAKAA